MPEWTLGSSDGFKADYKAKPPMFSRGNMNKAQMIDDVEDAISILICALLRNNHGK